MKENSGLKKLRDGEIVLGIMLIEVTNVEIIPVIKSIGFDAVFIDLEHGAFSMETTKAFARICNDNDIWFFARVNNHEPKYIARIMDLGVKGIMLAKSEDPIELRKLIYTMKYPPLGTKGFGIRGVHTNYEPISVEEKMKYLNENSAIILLIESKKGIDNLEELAKLPFVDALYIGPNDLSISLGYIGESNHPRVQKSVNKVIQVAQKNNLAIGYYSTDIEILNFWKNQGIRFLFCGTEISLLKEAGKKIIKSLR
jgi:2-keto-3-deoxy-L-rhamnonate aldolase RhmA